MSVSRSICLYNPCPPDIIQVHQPVGALIEDINAFVKEPFANLQGSVGRTEGRRVLLEEGQ